MALPGAERNWVWCDAGVGVGGSPLESSNNHNTNETAFPVETADSFLARQCVMWCNCCTNLLIQSETNFKTIAADLMSHVLQLGGKRHAMTQE